MKRAFLGILAGLAIGLAAPACSDRPLGDDEAEEEPPPDIEGLCEAHCVRVMECVWSPDIGAEFSTLEGCQQGCEGDNNWDECPRATEAVFACRTQYDCPEFPYIGTEEPDGPCVAEVHAYGGCVPE